VGIVGQFQRDELLGKIECKVFHARDQCSFVRTVTVSLSERWQNDGYVQTELNAPISFGRSARSDDTNQLTFALRISLWYDKYLRNAGVTEANRMEAFFQYRFTTRDSNIQSDGYDQNIFFASLKLNF